MKNRISLPAILLIYIASLTFGITITTQDMGGGQLQIGYQLEPGEIALGFALEIELSHGAYIASPSDAVASSHFPVFMDFAYSTGSFDGGTPIANSGIAGIPSGPVSNFSICMGAPHNETGSIGDFNDDGKVDHSDLELMANDWLNYSTMTDLNGDGIVNLVDYEMLAAATWAWAGSLNNLTTLFITDGGSGFTDVTITADSLRGGIIGHNINRDIGIVQTTVVIPEPATVTLLALGGLALRRKK